jgi:hypothetical protein
LIAVPRLPPLLVIAISGGITGMMYEIRFPGQTVDRVGEDWAGSSILKGGLRFHRTSMR